jgi:hypothetical protein
MNSVRLDLMENKDDSNNISSDLTRDGRRKQDEVSKNLRRYQTE